jgi:Arc/MetJ-type ribon-helix-helix transcriptional regulator
MSINVEISEDFRKVVERRTNEGNFSSVNEYIESLVARDNELEALLDEAEEDIERGDYQVHQAGDIMRMGEEIIRRHLEAKGQ